MKQFHLEQSQREKPSELPEFDIKNFKKKYNIPETKDKADLEEIERRLVNDIRTSRDINPTDVEDIHISFLKDDDLIVYDTIANMALGAREKTKSGAWKEALEDYTRIENIINEYTTPLKEECAAIYQKEERKRIEEESAGQREIEIRRAGAGGRDDDFEDDIVLPERRGLAKEMFERVRKAKPAVCIREEFFAMLRNHNIAETKSLIIKKSAEEKRQKAMEFEKNYYWELNEAEIEKIKKELIKGGVEDASYLSGDIFRLYDAVTRVSLGAWDLDTWERARDKHDEAELFLVWHKNRFGEKMRSKYSEDIAEDKWTKEDRAQKKFFEILIDKLEKLREELKKKKKMSQVA